MPGQTTGRLHEQNANNVIADWLNSSGRQWRAESERAGAIQGSAERIDIIVSEGDRMPVAIECEWARPAVADAAKRLGKTKAGETRAFTEAIAVGIDPACQHDSQTEFRQRLDRNELILSVQLVSQGSGGNAVTWPERPLPATPQDLAVYCEYAQVPQAVIDQESASVARQIDAAGQKLLEGIALTSAAGATLAALRQLTGCDHDESATRTAAAIWLIAIDLQNDLAAYSPELRQLNLKSTDELIAGAMLGKLTGPDLLAQWRIIAGVNYLPVIELAISTLSAGQMGRDLSDVLEHLHRLSEQLNALAAKHIYNFAGELWQRIVSDREERAAHYTQPPQAELLSTIAAARLAGRTAAQLAKAKILDAACGTGTLIGAGERAIRRLYIADGGNDLDALHKSRMENHIYAMDVNGIAGTLTAKRLTDMNVAQDYHGSNIVVITDPAGSLSLLDPGRSGISQVLGYRNATPTAGAGGDMGYIHVPLQGIDIALMNPPYSRPMPGRGMATTGLEKPRADAKRHKYTMSHGMAGLASDFGNLSNIRLAPGGVYAHVQPLTAARSGSWKSWRTELEKDFYDILVIANVAAAELQSMSADTNLNEMLVIATKRDKRPAQWQSAEILCVNLRRSPATLAEGYAMGQEINRIPASSTAGTLTNGFYARISQTEPGLPWNAVGDSNAELTQVTAAMLNGQAYDPVTLATLIMALPMTTLSTVATIGPSGDLIGHTSDSQEKRGAFEWFRLDPGQPPPAHLSMWAADAKAHTAIATAPTHGGRVVNQPLAQRLAQQRCHWFFKRNMGWGAQATTVAYMADAAHGGAAWTGLLGMEDAAAKAVALYYNSIFGGITRNGYGSNQKPGRSEIRMQATAGVPCPAFHADTLEAEHARALADQHFQELSELPLQSFAYCFQDTNRHRIDNVVAEMLGLDPADPAVQEMLAYWRALFAGEPNVNGRQRKIVAALAKHQGK